MNTKICKVCKKEKDYSEFHKSKLCVGGVRTTCKECRREEKKNIFQEIM
jgi:superfamily II helicase